MRDLRDQRMTSCDVLVSAPLKTGSEPLLYSAERRLRFVYLL